MCWNVKLDLDDFLKFDLICCVCLLTLNVRTKLSCLQFEVVSQMLLLSSSERWTDGVCGVVEATEHNLPVIM